MINLQALTEVMNSKPDAEFTLAAEILSDAGISVSSLEDKTDRKSRKSRRLVKDDESTLLLVQDDYSFSPKIGS